MQNVKIRRIIKTLDNNNRSQRGISIVFSQIDLGLIGGCSISS
jgi:hypothetical protein